MATAYGPAFLSLEHMYQWQQDQLLRRIDPLALQAIYEGPSAYVHEGKESGGPVIHFGTVEDILNPLKVLHRSTDGLVKEVPIVALVPVSREDYLRLSESGGDVYDAFGFPTRDFEEVAVLIEHLARRWRDSA